MLNENQKLKLNNLLLLSYKNEAINWALSIILLN